MTEDYKKARKQYVLFSAIIWVWVIVGLDINKINNTTAGWISAIESPELIPFILFLVVLYFSLRTTISWSQIGRSNINNIDRVDYAISHFIGISSAILIIIENITSKKVKKIIINILSNEFWMYINILASIIYIVLSYNLISKFTELHNLRKSYNNVVSKDKSEFTGYYKGEYLEIIIIPLLAYALLICILYIELLISNLIIMSIYLFTGVAFLWWEYKGSYEIKRIESSIIKLSRPIGYISNFYEDIRNLPDTIQVNKNPTEVVNTNIVTLTRKKSNAFEEITMLSYRLSNDILNENKNVVAFFHHDYPTGNTTISINVSVSLSIIGKKVMLLDLDLRRPKVHDYLCLSKDPGFCDLLYDRSISHNVLSCANNLNVCTSGKSVPSPSRTISSKNCIKLIHEISDNYDVVIIDTPPIKMFSEHIPISNFSDVGIMTVEGRIPNDVGSISKIKNSMSDSIDLYSISNFV